MSNSAQLSKRYCFSNGKKFRLKDVDPDDTAKFKGKDEAEPLLEENVRRLSDLQERLYAQDKWAVLFIFQAMDAAGKDGAIKHVLSGINPQGCHVTPFKAPSAEELDHDYLWRSARSLPERGRIGVFNRSYYEEVLVVRVHPECLERQKLPEKLVTKRIWRDRFEDITAYERYLSRNGVVVRKFFLHVSHKEQEKRLLARLEEKEKNWKFSIKDLDERKLWDDYMAAYEEMVQQTATEEAPWYVVPADHKWFTRLVVSSAMVDTLEGLDLQFPKLTGEQKKELAIARKILADEVEKKQG